MLKLMRRCRQHGHVLGEGLETLDVFVVPLVGGLVEEDGKDLHVVVAEGFGTDIVFVFVEGDADLVEDHEKLLEAVVVGEELRITVDYTQLLITLFLHLEGEYFRTQSEVAPGLQCPFLLSRPHLHARLRPGLGSVVKAHLSFVVVAFGRVFFFEGTAGELGVDSHITILAAVLAGQPRGFDCVHQKLILQECSIILEHQYVIKVKAFKYRKTAREEDTIKWKQESWRGVQ